MNFFAHDHCLYSSMRNVKYSYSSVQINLPDDLSKKIVTWGKDHIANKEIYQDPQNPTFGRENEMHVTLLYGLHGDNSTQSRLIVKNHDPFVVKLGLVDIFENDVFDVVVVKAISEELHALNKKLKSKVKFTNKFPVYKPHITIAYVKKGEGKKYKDNPHFQNMSFDVKNITFSSKKGYKEVIRFDEQGESFRAFFESFKFSN